MLICWSISENADLLGFFSLTTISGIYREQIGKEEISGEQQFSGQKCLIDAKGQTAST